MWLKCTSPAVALPSPPLLLLPESMVGKVGSGKRVKLLELEKFTSLMWSCTSSVKGGGVDLENSCV
ncbi:hypothetical protein Hanom_Chr10g00874621 [Helianthus anomalus]